MSFRPVVFVWNAREGVMRVAARFGNVARAQFRDGEEYPLYVREHRSSKSHAFFFASVKNAHDNLSAENTEILQTPEHLRKWALIVSGWYDETLVDAGEGKYGRRRAIQMAGFARKLDDFAEIKVIKHGENWFLRVRVAKSQSLSSMDKEEFKKSSRDVLDVLSGTIEVRRADLEKIGRESVED